jgi:hypothetical protein
MVYQAMFDAKRRKSKRKTRSRKRSKRKSRSKTGATPRG